MKKNLYSIRPNRLLLSGFLTMITIALLAIACSKSVNQRNGAATIMAGESISYAALSAEEAGRTAEVFCCQANCFFSSCTATNAPCSCECDWGFGKCTGGPGGPKEAESIRTSAHQLAHYQLAITYLKTLGTVSASGAWRGLEKLKNLFNEYKGQINDPKGIQAFHQAKQTYIDNISKLPPDQYNAMIDYVTSVNGHNE